MNGWEAGKPATRKPDPDNAGVGSIVESILLFTIIKTVLQEAFALLSGGGIFILEVKLWKEKKN